MRFSGFIKLPKHRQFNYTPRYYDERKEKLEEKSVENDSKNIIKEDKKRMSDYYFAKAKYSKQQSIIRRLIISVTIVLLVIAIYLASDLYSKIFQL